MNMLIANNSPAVSGDFSRHHQLISSTVSDDYSHHRQLVSSFWWLFSSLTIHGTAIDDYSHHQQLASSFRWLLPSLAIDVRSRATFTCGEIPSTVGLFSWVLWRQSMKQTEPVRWNRLRKCHFDASAILSMMPSKHKQHNDCFNTGKYCGIPMHTLTMYIVVSPSTTTTTTTTTTGRRKHNVVENSSITKVFILTVKKKTIIVLIKHAYQGINQNTTYVTLPTYPLAAWPPVGQTDTQTRAHTLSNKHTDTCTHLIKQTHIHVHTPYQTNTQTRTHTLSKKKTDTYTYLIKQAHRHVHTPYLKKKQTRTHTLSNKHTDTYTHLI